MNPSSSLKQGDPLQQLCRAENQDKFIMLALLDLKPIQQEGNHAWYWTPHHVFLGVVRSWTLGKFLTQSLCQLSIIPHYILNITPIPSGKTSYKTSSNMLLLQHLKTCTDKHNWIHCRNLQTMKSPEQIDNPRDRSYIFGSWNMRRGKGRMMVRTRILESLL